MSKQDELDTLTAYGAEVKALGGGKLGGYLVKHSTPNDPDATLEYFDAKTDLGEPSVLPVLYHHGLDVKIGKRRIGTASTKRDDAGLWIEAQLDLRDEYEKAIYKLAEEGKLGWSSGAAAHAVTRTREQKATHIDQWYIAEASLTPTPAEWRNGVIPLKTLIGNAPQAEPEASAQTLAAQAESDENNNIHEVKDMEEKDILALMEKREQDKALAAKAVADAKIAHDAEIKAVVESALKGVVTPAAEAGVKTVNINAQTGRGFASDAVKGFLHYIRTGQKNGALVPDGEVKAAMQGQTDSEGGYAVPDDFYNNIIAKRNEVSIIRQMGVVSFPTSLDRVLVPTEDTAATKFVVTAEEGAYSENEPTLGQSICTIYKMTKLIKISEELEADAKANFGAYLANVWGRAMGLAENYYFFNIAANGTSQPQSVTYASTTGNTAASQTVTTAAEVLALIYAMPSAYTDNLKLVMRRSTLGALRAIQGTSSLDSFIFQPTPLGSNVSPNTANSQAGYIHNIPVFLTDELPAQASASVKYMILFNPDFYFLAEREGMSVSRNPYLYQANGQIGLFAKFREGGVATQTAAILAQVSLA